MASPLWAHPPSNPKSLSTESLIRANSENSSFRTQPKYSLQLWAGVIFFPWCFLTPSQYTEVSAVAIALLLSMGTCWTQQGTQQGTQHTSPGSNDDKQVCCGGPPAGMNSLWHEQAVGWEQHVGNSVWTPRYNFLTPLLLFHVFIQQTFLYDIAHTQEREFKRIIRHCQCLI